MRTVTTSFIRAQLLRHENGELSEHEMCQAVLDMCVERLIDYDGGRDDASITGSYRLSDLPSATIAAAVDELADEDVTNTPSERPIVVPRISLKPPPLPVYRNPFTTNPE